jgi:sugar O-acyltransferase (sialic acid O-acetyltransferase NeuD family)
MAAGFMSKPIVIVGAGRQGRVILDAFDAADANVVAGYLDDTHTGERVCGLPVLRGVAAIGDPAFVREHAFIVAIGDNVIRSDLSRTLVEAGATLVNAVHPASQMSGAATLGRGIYIGPYSSVGAGSAIGDFAVLAGHCRIGGDVTVGEGAFAGPGAILNGGSVVGARSFLGTGAIVSNGVMVGADCVVGANSTVLHDLPDGTAAHGTPARPAPLNSRPFRR